MSLFIVIVPTREHELHLRHKELNIVVEFAADEPIITTSAEILETDIYKGTTKDGHHADIIVADDYMEIKSSHSAGSGNSGGKGGKKGSSSPAKASLTDKESMVDESIQAEIDKYFLEKHLEDTLDRYTIMNATWSKSINGNMSQVSFPVSLNATDLIISRFHSVGIGSKYESSVTVCSAGVYFGPHKDIDTKKANSGDGEEGEGKDKNSGWSEFVKSIKSRLTVAQVVSQIQSNAVMTFDFLLLVLVAALIASLGLLESSSVILVASMLISPLMGPIMAFTFGTMIRSCELIRIGIVSEIVGLLICLVVGFVVGILLQLDLFTGVWAGKETAWPTEEMIGRGKMRGMVVGVMMAIPSGIGVALSILAGNAGSLVGVAIAASLLPPAVNCGVCWGLALVTYIKIGIRTSDWNDGCYDWKGKEWQEDVCQKKSLQCDTEFFNRHNKIYCENVSYEYVYLGIVSFALTGINIAIIFLVAILILKIKEVAPYTTRKSLRRFWKEDLAYTRKYMAQHHGQDISAGIMDDLKNAGGNVDDIRVSLDNDVTLNQVNRKTGGATENANLINDYKKGINKYTGQEINLPRHRREQLALEQSSENKGGGWFSWMGIGGSGGGASHEGGTGGKVVPT